MILFWYVHLHWTFFTDGFVFADFPRERPLVDHPLSGEIQILWEDEREATAWRTILQSLMRRTGRVKDTEQTCTLNCAAAGLACLSRGVRSSLRWYWLSRCRCSVSLTSSLTACRIPRQQACALCSSCRSGEDTTHTHTHTCKWCFLRYLVLA